MLDVDRERRMISGRAVPYNTAWHRALVLPRRYLQGSLHWGTARDVKLLIEHDHSLIVGKALTLTESSDGLWVVFQAARGARGDRALEMAAAIHCGLSVGIDDPMAFRLAADGVEECVSARLLEVSLTKNPVFP